MSHVLPFPVQYSYPVGNLRQEGPAEHNQGSSSVPTTPSFPMPPDDENSTVPAQSSQQTKQTRQPVPSKHVNYWFDEFPDKSGQRRLRQHRVPEKILYSPGPVSH
jgi:hypothetical protein